MWVVTRSGVCGDLSPNSGLQKWSSQPKTSKFTTWKLPKAHFISANLNQNSQNCNENKEQAQDETSNNTDHADDGANHHTARTEASFHSTITGTTSIWLLCYDNSLRARLGIHGLHLLLLLIRHGNDTLEGDATTSCDMTFDLHSCITLIDSTSSRNFKWLIQEKSPTIYPQFNL